MFLASDASDGLREQDATGLGHSGDQSQIAVLLPLLESSDEQTRDIAAISLGMLGNGQDFAAGAHPADRVA